MAQELITILERIKDANKAGTDAFLALAEYINNESEEDI